MSVDAPTPFKISVSQDSLDTLKRRLETTALPPPSLASNDPWEYGVPTTDISRILEYWKATYDWKAHETVLNEELPQFTLPVAVQDHGVLQAHFVHYKAKQVPKGKAIPLLFIHGWPGSFLEVKKVLPLLTQPENDDDPVFDVVAPSLPGFGFSSAPAKAGFAIDQYAEVRRSAIGREVAKVNLIVRYLNSSPTI